MDDSEITCTRDRAYMNLLNLHDICVGLREAAVLHQDAKRMLAKGWLNQRAAERFGLGKETV